jgi:hypothetical protein
MGAHGHLVPLALVAEMRQAAEAIATAVAGDQAQAC